MTRYLLFLLVSLFTFSMNGQSDVPFTAQLQKHDGGQGSVTLIQDEEITNLVNTGCKEGAPKQEVPPATSKKETRHDASSKTTKDSSRTAKADTAAIGALLSPVSPSSLTKYNGTRARHKARGYRIQVYSGTGNATAKNAAKQMEARVRRAFPELAVYCRFRSPRWICRVGDFSTRGEAQSYLTKIRKMNISDEATIVSDEVFVVN